MKSISSTENEVTTWTTNQIVFATLFVVCVFLSFWLLYRLRIVLFLLFIAIVLGTAIRPAVEWLYRRGISRALGILLVYVLIAGLIAILLASVLPLLAEQITQLSQNFPEFYGTFRNSLLHSQNRLLQNLGMRIPPQLGVTLNRTPTAEQLLDQVAKTILYANFALRGILSTLAIFLLAYYWTQEGGSVLRTVIRLLPQARRKMMREFFQASETRIADYIRGEIILCFLVGAAAFFAYILIGLPFSFVLAIFAGVMEAIPIFGPVLGGIPAFLVALSIAPVKALWVVIATTLIQMLENLFLVPRIMHSSIGTNPIIILLSLIAFGSVFGLPGAILALPLAAVIQLLINRIVIAPDHDLNGQPRPKPVEIQPLHDESERLTLALDMILSKDGGALTDLPEANRSEIQTVAQELRQFIAELKNEYEDEIT